MADKVKVADKVYLYADGEESRRVKADAKALEFRFAESGAVSQIELDKVGPNALRAAAYHGIAQRCGDTYAGAKTKGMSPDDCFNAVEAIRELLYDDTWATEGVSAGPRISLIFEAIVAAKLTAGANREEIDDNAVRANIKANGVKAALAVPAIRAEYDRIKLERMAAASAKSTKAADADESNGLDDF